MFNNYDLSAMAQLLRWAGPALIVFALMLGGFAAAYDDSGPVMRLYLRYTSWLTRELRKMFIFTDARKIVAGQAFALLCLLLCQALIGIDYWYLGLLLIAVAPAAWIQSERKKRFEQLEEQLDGTILAFANALKSVPSVGAAFQTLPAILQPPMAQEVELAVKEMKVGSTLDQALLHMASRIGSRQVDTALSAILIGRQVGGNLPKVLEDTAASLREMRRLEGVLRSKTAEARAQLVVLALMPVVLVIIMELMQPGYFDGMLQSFLGYVLIFVCIIAWLGAIFAARSILQVDI